ncbi:MAG: hypothetical protein V1913_15480 [Fibrobacterota bacterium]
MKSACPAVSILLGLLLVLAAAPALPAPLNGKRRCFPAESLSVDYLSHEVWLMTRTDSFLPAVDSTVPMTYVEFRLDTLVFEYRAAGDSIKRTLRVPKTRLAGFYYQSPVVDRSTWIVGAGVIAVIILFIL